MKQTLLWGLVLAFLAAPAAATTTLSFSASPAVVQVGDTVSLDVRVTDVTDLYAFQFDVAFDPAVLQLSQMLEGSFLGGSGGATAFVAGAIDNLAGTVSFTANTLLGPGAGATGSGVLARLVLQATAAGSSELAFGNVMLLDSTLADIAAVPSTGAIDVTAVPEPASAVLTALGLAVLAAAGRRRAFSPASA